MEAEIDLCIHPVPANDPQSLYDLVLVRLQTGHRELQVLIMMAIIAFTFLHQFLPDQTYSTPFSGASGSNISMLHSI